MPLPPAAEWSLPPRGVWVARDGKQLGAENADEVVAASSALDTCWALIASAVCDPSKTGRRNQVQYLGQPVPRDIRLGPPVRKSSRNV